MAALVSATPGTTRDPVDTELVFDGLPVVLVDTAGIRRRGHIDEGIEKFALLRTVRAIERAETVLGSERVKYIHPDCGFWMLKRNIADGKIRALVKGRDLHFGQAA